MLKEVSLPSIFSAPQNKLVRTTGIKQVSLTRKVLVFFLVAVNIALLFSYILGVNTRASVGYEIKSLHSKINALSQENKKLNLQISERASVANLQAELSQSGFTVIQDSKFLAGESQYSQK